VLNCFLTYPTPSFTKTRCSWNLFSVCLRMKGGQSLNVWGPWSSYSQIWFSSTRGTNSLRFYLVLEEGTRNIVRIVVLITPRPTWSNWRRMGHIWPAMTFNQAGGIFNLILIISSSFTFFTPKNIKNLDSYLVCCYAHKCHACYRLPRPCRKV
jgi:hypothetical protein